MNVRHFSLTTVTFNNDNLGNTNEIEINTVNTESSHTSNSENGESVTVSSVTKTEESSCVTENVVETKETILDFIPEKPTNSENGESLTVSNVTKTEENSCVTENVVETKETFLDFIPEKPTPFQTPYAENAPDMVHYIGDPPFEQLGLNSWWPTGWVQWGMENIHVGLDMPWLGAILISKFFLLINFLVFFSQEIIRISFLLF